MKYFLDSLKVGLLAAIAVPLYINTFSSQEASPSVDPAQERKPADLLEERKHDLQVIMEKPLRDVFKFPEDVKFKDVQFTYSKVFADAGFKLNNPALEVEKASMCGFYTAKNGMGAYGGYNRFVANIAVHNEEKSLGGSVLFENDGKVKELYSLESSYPLPGKKKELDQQWQALCGDIAKSHLGQFADYEMGSSSAWVGEFFSNYVTELVKREGIVEFSNACMSKGVKLVECTNQFVCKNGTDEEKNSKYCKLMDETCSAEDDEKACDIKMAKLKELEKAQG